MSLIVYSVKHMPLADARVIFYTSPVYTTCYCQIFSGFSYFLSNPFLVAFALLSYSTICGFSPRMYLLTYDLQTQKSIILCIS